MLSTQIESESIRANKEHPMITVPERHLVACLYHAGKKDVRFYLNSVAVEVTAAGRVVCIATDGDTLFAVDGGSVPEGTPAQTIIIPRDIVELIKPGKRGDLDATIIPPSPGDNQDYWLLKTCDGIFIFMPMKAHYPSWRAVFPAFPAKPEAGHFNPELVMRFTRSARMLLGRKERAHANILQDGPKRSALVSFPAYSSAAGVIMPWKSVTPDSIAAWIHSP